VYVFELQARMIRIQNELLIGRLGPALH
jgi:hypothetical protein